jgi:hypothetical protein
MPFQAGGTLIIAALFYTWIKPKIGGELATVTKASAGVDKV